mgnify:CR=1 FL=1
MWWLVYHIPALFDKSDASFNEYSRVTRKEVFLSDTLNVGDSWDFIIGARYGSLEDDYGDYKESEITPSFAAIYRPLEWMSIYASYVEAFEQGATAPNTAAKASPTRMRMMSSARMVKHVMKVLSSPPGPKSMNNG